jgi:hypothetical protein
VIHGMNKCIEAKSLCRKLLTEYPGNQKLNASIENSGCYGKNCNKIILVQDDHIDCGRRNKRQIFFLWKISSARAEQKGTNTKRKRKTNHSLPEAEKATNTH